MRVPAQFAASAEVRVDTGYIPLRGRDGKPRAFVAVDLADLEELSAFSWHLCGGRYPHRWIRKGLGELLHRRLLGLTAGDPRQGDHIDRDPLNARRSNLRIVPTDGANKQNLSPRGTTSRHRGVSYDFTHRRWLGQVRVDGRCIFSHLFATEAAAADAVRAVRREHMPYALD